MKYLKGAEFEKELCLSKRSVMSRIGAVDREGRAMNSASLQGLVFTPAEGGIVGGPGAGDVPTGVGKC